MQHTETATTFAVPESGSTIKSRPDSSPAVVMNGAPIEFCGRVKSESAKVSTCGEPASGLSIATNETRDSELE